MKISIESCKRCAPFVCGCGFLAALALFLGGDGKPPPSRTAAAIASAAPAPTGTMGYSNGWHSLAISNEITGVVYSAIWSEPRQEQLPLGPTAAPGQAYRSPPDVTGTTGPSGTNSEGGPNRLGIVVPTGPQGGEFWAIRASVTGPPLFSVEHRRPLYSEMA